MVSFDSKTYSKKLLHLISWSHWFTFFNIVAAVLLSTVYLVNEASPETFTGHVYLITTWLSHMAFITFITFVLTVFPLTLLVPRTRFIRASASIIFTVVMLLLLLDAFIYFRLGYHIDASSTSQIIELISQEIKTDRRMFWFVSIILTLVILTFELVVSNYAWKHLKQLQKTVFARFIVFGLVVAFFISHLTHIWADANLEYDVLKQDTILPLSYPSTAKTLLTKYGLFNLEDYIERKTSPLSFNEKTPNYPTLHGQCPLENVDNSAIIILTKTQLTESQIKQFAQRNSAETIKLTHHIDDALFHDAWFNLFYGLPTIYKKELIEQNQKPLLIQASNFNQLATSFTAVGENKERVSTIDIAGHFDKNNQLTDISSIVLPNVINQLKPGLHVVYFDSEDNTQTELFIDGLLLAQRQKQNKDIIYVSSIGNDSQETSLTIKPAMLIMPNKKSMSVDKLTSQMDISHTLLTQWLDCNNSLDKYTSGQDILSLEKDRVIANTITNGMVVFNKDKSVFIDQNGNFQSYSRQLAAPITVSSDFPLMIDGVHFIKQFSESDKAEQ